MTRRTITAVVVVVGIAVTVTVVVRVRVHGHARHASAATVDAGTVATLAAVSVVDVVGARRAAVAAVEESARVLRAGPLSRRDLIGELATARFAGELTERSNDQARNVRLGPGVDTVTAVEQPITAGATVAADGVVSVRVWSVLVVAVSRAEPARAVWRTSTLSMRMERDRWRVDGWVSTLGPAPAPPLDAGGSASFDAVTEVVSWPTALEG